MMWSYRAEILQLPFAFQLKARANYTPNIAVSSSHLVLQSGKTTPEKKHDVENVLAESQRESPSMDFLELLLRHSSGQTGAEDTTGRKKNEEKSLMSPGTISGVQNWDEKNVQREMEIWNCVETYAREYDLAIVKYQDLVGSPNDGGTPTKLELCGKRLLRLSPNIGLFDMTVSLQLCCNELGEIPPQIGYLKNLQYLYVSKNRLKYLPDTIGFLTNLREFDAAENVLRDLPANLIHCTKLEGLSLNRNQFAIIPLSISKLTALTHLDFSYNNISVVPAEIGKLKRLQRIRLEGCPLMETIPILLSGASLSNKLPIPSLKELSARIIVRNQLPILRITQQSLKEYLGSVNTCSFCGGPYFEFFVKRYRFLHRLVELNLEHEQNDARPHRVAVPIEYSLCFPHWNNERERVAIMFASLPHTAPQQVKNSARVTAMRKGLKGLVKSLSTSNLSNWRTNTSTLSVSESSHVSLEDLVIAAHLPPVPFMANREGQHEEQTLRSRPRSSSMYHVVQRLAKKGLTRSQSTLP